MRIWMAPIIGMIAASVTAQDLKPFDFMGFTAGQSIEPSKLKKCGKGGDVSCFEALAKLSTVYVGYMVKTHNYKLESVYVDANPRSYFTILEAFEAKYGKPCKIEASEWKNAAGLALENPISHWCFSTGHLTVSRYGPRIDKMGIFYQDNNSAPKPAPVVNF